MEAAILIISIYGIIASIPFAMKASLAYKKKRIEKRASQLGYDLKFDD